MYNNDIFMSYNYSTLEITTCFEQLFLGPEGPPRPPQITYLDVLSTVSVSLSGSCPGKL